jgi:thioredoxin reductase (NADPH)
MTVPIAIIGAGPAGIEAAIQLRRSRIEFLLLEKDRVGGLLNEANRVENFPGVPGGVPGRILAGRLKRQLAVSGIQVEKAHVQALAFRSGRFMLQTEERTLAADKVILACGTQPLPPEPPLEAAPLRGRLFASVLPLLRARQETIVVIGGGDTAFDYALSLGATNEVHILVRSESPRALPLLVDRCRRHRRISIHENCLLTRVVTREGVAEITLKTVDALDGRGGEIRCRRILTAIGRAPALDFLDQELRPAIMDLARRKMLFLAGDAANGRFRQAAIAAADGLRAAMEIQAGESGCA